MAFNSVTILTKKEPEKKLTVPLKKTGGRSRTTGRITVRHRGGGAKRKYRIIDFNQRKMNISAEVEAIEYDPNRSAYIMLLKYKDGEKCYQLAPEGIRVGDEIICAEKTDLKIGNRMKLENIPIGFPIYNIELYPNKGGQIVRSAGTAAQILAKEGKNVTISLPSKEIRLVSNQCFASLGQISNPSHKMKILGKAGISRRRGRRPTVRGSVMNPRDHPHGGGEGKTQTGLVHPKTPWGKPARGKKTRKKGKWSDRFIIKRRGKK